MFVTAPACIRMFSTVLMSLCQKVQLQEVVWSLEFGPGSPQQLVRLSTLLQALKGCNFKNPKPPLKVPLEFTKPPYFNTSFRVMLVVFSQSSSYNFLLAWITIIMNVIGLKTTFAHKCFCCQTFSYRMDVCHSQFLIQ